METDWKGTQNTEDLKKKKKKDSRTLAYYYRKLFQTDVIEISKIDSAIKIHFVS